MLSYQAQFCQKIQQLNFEMYGFQHLSIKLENNGNHLFNWVNWVQINVFKHNVHSKGLNCMALLF